MATKEAVKRALTMLDAVPAWYRANLTDRQLVQRSAVYEIGLEDLTDEQLGVAVRLALKRQGAFMPTPGELVAFVRPLARLEADVQTSAQTAYQRLLHYFEQGGNTLSFTRVEDWLGFAAAHAFMAAGGNASFSWCEKGRDEQMRHKRFVDAYVQHEKAAASERAALTEGDALRLTRAEASRVLAKVVTHDEAQG